MKKISKLFLSLFIIAGLTSCSNILSQDEKTSDGKYNIKIKISAPEATAQENADENARTVFPINSSSIFKNISLSYSDSSSQYVEKTSVASWESNLTAGGVCYAEFAVPEGTKYFTLSAERYGATFTQTKAVEVKSGERIDIEFDSLKVSETSNQVGLINVKLILPEVLKDKITTVKAYYCKTNSILFDETELAYKSSENSVLFTKENADAGCSYLKIKAFDSDENQIFVYPVKILVQAGYQSYQEINANPDNVALDSTRIVNVTYCINESSVYKENYIQNYYPGCNLISVETAGFSVDGKKFTKWNTAADGSGEDYYEGNSPDFTGNVTLYAIWVDANAKTVTYDSNYPYGVEEEHATSYDSAETQFTVKTVTAARFAVKGYKFTGWNSKADGSGTSFESGNTYSITSDKTLYAQWEAYTLSYDVNGGSSYFYGSYSSTPKHGWKKIASHEPSSSYSYYTFLGWSKDKNAKTAVYAPGDEIEMTDDITLYAVWKLGTIVSESVVVSSSSERYLDFTLLKDEKISLKMKASGSSGLDFYVKTKDGSKYYYSQRKITSETNKTLELPTGEYRFLIENANIINNKTATFEVKGVE